MKIACSPLEGDAGISTLRIEFDGRNVLHPHEAAVLGLDDHALELVDVLQIGIGRHIRDDEIALGLARRGLEIVGGDGGGNVGGRNARPAMRMGSSHSRIAKVWPPRMSAEATPSTVESTGWTTRVR